MNDDKRIYNDLAASLERGLLSQHAHLDIKVHDGIVTIAGRVNTFAERKAVERAAKRVAGIRTLIVTIGAAAWPLSAGSPAQISRTVYPQGVH